MKLRLVLGDQLNINHSWFDTIDQEVIYVMFELKQEQEYTRHHIQKIIAFFLAMRSFAADVQALGHKLLYFKIDHPENDGQLLSMLQKLIKQYKIKTFEYIEPDEYRLDKLLKDFCVQLSINHSCVSSEHFFTYRMEVKEFFQSKKIHLMESFYRYMRKKHNILMNIDEPLGGQWNFDVENRKAFDFKVNVPTRFYKRQKVAELKSIIDDLKINYMGNIDVDNFSWPTTREDSLDELDQFCKHRLKYFGKYEDAMVQEEELLFHSRISFALNTKLLNPKEVCEFVIQYWMQHKEEIDIAQVEGFVRQIIGWREYVRGIYWEYMPNYKLLNHLQHERKLPTWYWNAETKMNCMKNCIGNSLDNAYAHHIQRLMVIGNFSLLAGLDPDELDEWYLGVYADAVEWVQLPNTRGMSQYADAGIMGSKPYVSSSNYIHKMSNYCKYCEYNRNSRIENDSCPFNALYWNFFINHEDKFANNPRIGMVYNNLRKMNSEEIEAIKKKSNSILNNLDSL